MKYTVVGDLHLEHNNMEKVETLFQMVEEIGNDVIMLGDTLDTKELIRGRCLNLLMRLLKKSKLNWIFLIGNHCWFNKDCEEHSLEALRDFHNIILIDKPTLQGNILFTPYYTDIAKFRSDINQLEFKDARVLFMHQGVIGFDYGNGFVAEGHGDGEMELSVLKRFQKVYSGHFHKYARKDNLTFLGTPFTHDQGETNQTKYLGVFDSKTLEMELVETPFPRHRTGLLGLGQGMVSDFRPKDLGNGDYWRVQLQGTSAEIAAFDQSKYPGVAFLEEPTDTDQIENSNIKDTDSNEQKFMVWARDLKNLDFDSISEGLEILKAS